MNLINYKIQNQHTKISSGPGILYSRLDLCLELSASPDYSIGSCPGYWLPDQPPNNKAQKATENNPATRAPAPTVAARKAFLPPLSAWAATPLWK